MPPTALTPEAAMEPAEDRPEDLGDVVAEPGDREVAAMEPAEDRPEDIVPHVRDKKGGGAAMEPAEDRPEDEADDWGDFAPVLEPQWSRPRIGRRTTRS